MTLFQNKYRIESIRLPEYDYSQPGIYFVTVCSYQRECIFGQIGDNKMELSSIGVIIKKFIPEIKQYFINVKTDAYIIMPNHIHIIFIIGEHDGGICDMISGTNRFNHRRDGVTPSLPVPIPHTFLSPSQIPPIRYQPTLGQIVGYYKYQTTKQINQFNKTIGMKIWQPRYYEHIIRNESELFRIREYIKNNPVNWQGDRNNV